MIAKNTERGYRSDWADFLEFCDQHGRQALPADLETVALYYAGLAEAGAPSTIKRRQASIKKAHQLAGRLSPTDHGRPKAVMAVMAGIRRELGVRPNQKSPLMTDLLRQLLEHIPTTTEAAVETGRSSSWFQQRPPALGARRPGRRGLARGPMELPRPDPAVEDRPGGRRGGDWHPVRPALGHLSGHCAQGLPTDGGTQDRPHIPAR